MGNQKKTYSVFQQASSIFMMLALLWLVISLPFVVASQQQLAAQSNHAFACFPTDAADEEASDSFGNTTEEKAPGGNVSLSEEYLHDHHGSNPFLDALSNKYAFENAGTYLAFHGELLVPPPNAAS